MGCDGHQWAAFALPWLAGALWLGPASPDAYMNIQCHLQSLCAPRTLLPPKLSCQNRCLLAQVRQETAAISGVCTGYLSLQSLYALSSHLHYDCKTAFIATGQQQQRAYTMPSWNVTPWLKCVAVMPCPCHRGALFFGPSFRVTRNKLTFRDNLAQLLAGSTPSDRNLERRFREWLTECHRTLDRSIRFERLAHQSAQVCGASLTTVSALQAGY